MGDIIDMFGNSPRVVMVRLRACAMFIRALLFYSQYCSFEHTQANNHMIQLYYCYCNLETAHLLFVFFFVHTDGIWGESKRRLRKVDRLSCLFLFVFVFVKLLWLL